MFVRSIVRSIGLVSYDMECKYERYAHCEVSEVQMSLVKQWRLYAIEVDREIELKAILQYLDKVNR